MVSLQKATNIDFAPFIALSYRCLYDYLRDGLPDHNFSLHQLGIYAKSYRFTLIILEKLFSTYLNGERQVNTTYDTFNYNREALYNARNNFDVFSFENEVLYGYPTILKLLEERPDIIDKIYYTPSLREIFYREIENLKNGDKLDCADVFSPINIYRNVNLDRFFDCIIDNYEIPETIQENRSIISLKYKVGKIFNNLCLKHATVFTTDFCKMMINNIAHIHRFHYLFIERIGNSKITAQDYEKLDKEIETFIETINFKYDLK